MISVIMTTYNGEKYIFDQMESIKNQTIHADEVVIRDDLSSDKTPRIVKKYIEDNGLSNWQFNINEKNIGWKKNFIEATKTVRGDIVFFADQDDIWLPDKIKSMCDVMKHYNADVVASNAEIFYSSDDTYLPPFYSAKCRTFHLEKIWAGKGCFSILNKMFKERKYDTGLVKKIEFDGSVMNAQRQGCVMAVKRDFAFEMIRYWEEICPHDTLMWIGAATRGTLFVLEKSTMKYRHHFNNTGFKDTIGNGINKKTELEKIKQNSALVTYLIRLIESISTEENRGENLCVLNDILKSNEARSVFLKNKRIKDGIELFKYKKIIGKRQLAFDWLLTYMTN